MKSRGAENHSKVQSEKERSIEDIKKKTVREPGVAKKCLQKHETEDQRCHQSVNRNCFAERNAFEVRAGPAIAVRRTATAYQEESRDSRAQKKAYARKAGARCVSVNVCCGRRSFGQSARQHPRWFRSQGEPGESLCDIIVISSALTQCTMKHKKQQRLET